MKIQPVPPIYRPTDYKGSNERKRPVKHPQGDMPRCLEMHKCNSFFKMYCRNNEQRFTCYVSTGGKNDLNT